MYSSGIRFERYVAILCVLWIVGVMGSGASRADYVTDWSRLSLAAIDESGVPPEEAYRINAVAQTSVFEAINAADPHYSSLIKPADKLQRDTFDSKIAAAAALVAVIKELLPDQEPKLRAKLEHETQLPWAKASAELGERVANEILRLASAKPIPTSETYRPFTLAGQYVPTMLPEYLTLQRRTPWILRSTDQLRLPAPPSLKSKKWAAAYQEVEYWGAKKSSKRTAEETDIAVFWSARVPGKYFGLLYSITNLPERTTFENARFLAMASQALDDSLMAVAEAKYHYSFWRPLTAIRNGDKDGNKLTERDASWLPLIKTPLHPEYPCSHCSHAGIVAELIDVETAEENLPVLKTTSPALPGIERSWQTTRLFCDEVNRSRILGGVHYRFSTEAGEKFGRSIGRLASEKYPRIKR
jgi:hypothetical protein